MRENVRNWLPLGLIDFYCWEVALDILYAII